MIGKTHHLHLKRIAISGGNATKKKMLKKDKEYYSRISKRGWRLRRKRERSLI